MTRSANAHQTVQTPRVPVSVCAAESLYLGIDIGKKRHMAGFVSRTLLTRHERFEGCPVLAFDNSREGFRQLVDRIKEFVPLEQCYVLVEKTGHYQRSLVEYLLALDVSLYVMHVKQRPAGLLKTDKRDALGLANHLYNQLEKGVQVAERAHLARRAVRPTETAEQLKHLMGHRHELVHESTQRKNKLTALCDQLFPEFTLVIKDPNAPAALQIRERFPTAEALATATLDAVCAAKGNAQRHGTADMIRLQDLARHSIGVTDPTLYESLAFEQRQLIRELRLLQEHLDEIDAEVARLIDGSREGQILVSIPGVGVISAAAIVAAIGRIDNFPSAAALKSYFGWSPTLAQSGTSLDHVAKTRGGERTMKEVMYLVALRAVQHEGAWAQLYHRLVSRQCRYDERTRSFRGKNKVVGRIAGQMTALMYALLKADAELLAKTPPGVSPPPPRCYDAALHAAHQSGGYRASKPHGAPAPIIRLPQR